MSNYDDSITGTPVGPSAASPGRQPAPLWRRLTAVGYDALLLAALFFAVTIVMVAAQNAAIGANTGWFQLQLSATGWLYFAWFWVHGGQTVGMRAWKIRVVDARNPDRSAGWGQATVRFLSAFLPAVPLAAIPAGMTNAGGLALTLGAYALAYGASLSHAKRACWHDLLSGTRLVRAS